MTSSGPGAPGGALGALVRAGPWLMLASVALVTAAFALTQRPRSPLTYPTALRVGRPGSRVAGASRKSASPGPVP